MSTLTAPQTIVGSFTAEAFAVVAFLPNRTRTGEVLIIAGSGMQGTRAAGDLVQIWLRLRARQHRGV